MTETLCVVILLFILFFLMIIPIIAFTILFKEDKKKLPDIEGARLVKR